MPPWFGERSGPSWTHSRARIGRARAHRPLAPSCTPQNTHDDDWVATLGQRSDHRADAARVGPALHGPAPPIPERTERRQAGDGGIAPHRAAARFNVDAGGTGRGGASQALLVVRRGAPAANPLAARCPAHRQRRPGPVQRPPGRGRRRRRRSRVEHLEPDREVPRLERPPVPPVHHAPITGADHALVPAQARHQRRRVRIRRRVRVHRWRRRRARRDERPRLDPRPSRRRCGATVDRHHRPGQRRRHRRRRRTTNHGRAPGRGRWGTAFPVGTRDPAEHQVGR